MSIQLDSASGSITIIPEDGSGNANVTFPRAGYLSSGGALGTPSSGTLTNCTGLPTAGGGTGLSSAGASGNVLTSNGTTWTSSTPAAGFTMGKAIAAAMIFGL